MGTNEEETRRVLVVDDDAELRTLLVRTLDRSGLLADGASDGREALEFLERRRYAVALVDLLMPKMNGLRLLSQLRAYEPRPVVLVVTGAPDGVIDQVDPNLVHGVVRKPFDVDELTELVRTCAEIRSRRSWDLMCLMGLVASAELIRWF